MNLEQHWVEPQDAPAAAAPQFTAAVIATVASKQSAIIAHGNEGTMLEQGNCQKLNLQREKKGANWRNPHWFHK
jgi:hypothetical protein